jgi:hypothetical protein
VAGVLCLVLAFVCLVAAAATLSAQTVPGDVAPSTPGALRQPLPLVIPLVFLIFLLVVAAVLRREHGRAAVPAPSLRRPPVR